MQIRNVVVVLIGTLVSVALILSVSNYGATDDEEGGAVIGVILPLTGEAAVYGQALQNGILLAHELSGDPHRLVIEDDGGKSATSVAAVRKLIDVDDANILIGGAQSSTALPLIPVIEAENAILVSPTATNPELTKEGGNFFRLWPSDNFDGQLMAGIAYDKLKVRRVAIIHVDAAYGVGVSGVFKREFEALGGEVVAMESYLTGATDFRAQLLAVQSANPEAVYLPGYVTEVSRLMRQADELNYDVQFLGVNAFFDPQLIELAQRSAEGAVFTYPVYEDVEDDGITGLFNRKYRERFGMEPDVFAAQGYDAYRVVSSALQRSEALDAETIKSALRSTSKFPGAGGEITFESDGDVRKPLAVYEIRDSSFVRLYVAEDEKQGDANTANGET